MTKLATRKAEIEALEGFNINIYTGAGKSANLDMQGQPEYPYKNKGAGSMTVLAWKNNRFQQTYPGFTCDVLDKGGNVAHGNTLLKSIR